MLITKNLKQKRSNKKLLNKTIDSFIIRNRIKMQAYRLALSFIYQIYNVFHISFLKLYKCKIDNNNIFQYIISKLVNDIEK